MRRVLGRLLLAGLLLFSQQGAVLHELAHRLKGPDAAKQAVADLARCDLCAAYADLGGAMSTGIAAPRLLSSLSFHHASDAPARVVGAPAPAARSRGPPHFL